ncbi:MAG: PspA/IM30 family protein [Xanthomonadales bacterium]|nr:PspA/IM30 family protein [Xanthomonadales bacterium]
MQRTTQEVDEWQRRAELAVSKGRDDLAKAALAEKQRYSEGLAAFEEQHKELDLGLNKLNDDIAALQDKLADAKNRQKTLQARHHTAANQLHARKRIYDARINDAMGRFEHYERKLEDMEGKVEAYDLGKQHGLDREFADLESGEHVEAELAALKQRMAAGNASVKE